MHSPGVSLLPDDSPDPEFVPSKPDPRYYCTICRRVLRSPVQTFCGHRFCQSCLVSKLEEVDQLRCPIGEEDCEVLTIRTSDVGGRHFSDDFSMRRDVSNLEVKCLNQKNGCKEQMKYKDLATHMESCRYTQVPCRHRHLGCQVILPKADLERHVQQCEYRPERCQYCNADIARKKMQHHVDVECPNRSRPCRFCGQGPFSADEMQRHFVQECPNRPKPCPFEPLGCATTVPDESMTKHEQDGVLDHLRMVPRTISGLEAENRQLREKMDQLRSDLLGARLEAESMAQKVKNAQKQVVRYGERVNKLEEKLTGGFVDQVHAHEERLKTMEGSGRVGGNRGEESDSRSTAILELRVNELDDRLKQSQSISYDGTLIWKIDDYNNRKQEAKEGRNLSLYSQPFYTSRYGYKMRARAYLNGDGAGKHNNLSLFFVIMRGEFDALLEWPFKQKVTLMLLDQKENAFHLSDTFRPDVNSTSFSRPTTDMNIASGCPKFAAHEVVESGNVYLRDDCIFVKVVVDTSYLKQP
ncbi:TNF receptor-associated factor 3-like isoform X2 [Lineus longissimus]